MRLQVFLQHSSESRQEDVLPSFPGIIFHLNNCETRQPRNEVVTPRRRLMFPPPTSATATSATAAMAADAATAAAAAVVAETLAHILSRKCR